MARSSGPETAKTPFTPVQELASACGRPGGAVRWLGRVTTVGAASLALMAAYVVPTAPVVMADDGVSAADREAAAAAAAPPARDDGGNWFTDMFGGGDEGPDLDEVPADRELPAAAQPAEAPQAAAPEPGERVRELKGARTTTSRTFLLDDGRRQTELAGKPLFYATSGEGMLPIDTTVHETVEAAREADAHGVTVARARGVVEEGWRWANVSNSARSFFGVSADQVARVEDAAGRGVTMGLATSDRDLSDPSVDGDTVVHEDVKVLGGADLEYRVEPGRLKELVVLSRQDLAALREDGHDAVSFAFVLSDLGGLEPRQEGDGGIGFHDPEAGPAAGPVASIPAGLMWDSRETETTTVTGAGGIDGELAAPDDEGRAVSRDVAYELTRVPGSDGEGASWILTVTPDADWLLDPARVGDVTIDPTIVVAPLTDTSVDTMVLSEAPDANFFDSGRLSVGRTEAGVARAMLRFDALGGLGIPASKVTGAELGLYYDQAHTEFDSRVPLEVHTVKDVWESSTVTWNTMVSRDLEGPLAGVVRSFNNTDPAVRYTGDWPASGSTLTQYAYYQDYQSTSGNGDGTTDEFIVEPDLPVSGAWQVRTSHVPDDNRAAAAHVDVLKRDGGTKSWSVDMTRGTASAVEAGNQGVWTVLGDADLAAGAGNSRISVNDRNVSTSKVVIADGVRLVRGGTAIKEASTSGRRLGFDVTGTVQDWLSGARTNNGFIVRATDETANGLLGGPRFLAGEEPLFGGETRAVPRLTITYGTPSVELETPDTIHATGAELDWTTYRDPSSGSGDDLVEYQVHRSVSQTFTPSAETLVAPVAPGTTSFTDTTATPTPAGASAADEQVVFYQVAVKRKDGTLLPSTTQIVRLPRAGRTKRVITATGDTSLASGAPDLNLDKVLEYSPTLGRDTEQYWTLAGNASAAYGNTRLVAEWDDSTWDIPANAIIDEADLHVWQVATETDDATADRVYQVRRQLTDFDEARATWNDPDGAGSGTWTTAGGDHNQYVQDTVVNPGEGPARWSLDVSTTVQGWANDPSVYRSLLIRMRDENLAQDRTIFDSTESAENGGLERSGPRLVIEYLDNSPEATFHAPGAPDRMTPGSAQSVKLTLTNTTSTAWTTTGQHVRAAWVDGAGVEVAEAGTAALPRDLPSRDGATFGVPITAPGEQASRREDLSLQWELVNTAAAAMSEQETARAEATADAAGSRAATNAARSAAVSGEPLSDAAREQVAEDAEAQTLAGFGIAALPSGKMKQNVTIEDPSSDQLGLESFYTYAGKNTGAGSTVMNNVAAGNAVWSYDMFSNPGRGLNTFARVAYNSQDVSDTTTGNGWSAQISGPIRLGAPLEFHPNPGPTKILLPDGDGTTHAFLKNSTTGEWTAPAGVNYRLTQLASDADVHCPTDKDYIDEAWELLRPDGTRFIFGCDGYQTFTVDKNGNTMSFTYTSRNSNNQPRKFLSYVTDPAGRVSLQVDYWDKGRSGYTYVDDTTGALVQESGKLSNSKIYDHVRSVTDISGRKAEFYYTTQGNLGRIVDGAGATDEAGESIAKHFRFVYEMTQGGKNIKLATATDPRGNPTLFDYYLPSEGDDPKDHWELQTITDRLGYTTSFDYVPHATNDGWWNSTVTDAENHVTEYVSDGFGRPRSVTNAKDETVSLTWDGDNNVRTLTEANGAVTAYCYDPRTGYPLWQRDAEQNEAHGGAPAASECVPGETAEQMPAGVQANEYRTWESGHVAQIARTTSPAGRKNQFTYDAVGNLLTVTDGKGLATATAGDYTTTYTYDQYGQLLTATDANENTTTYSDFTAAGFPERETDALENVWSTAYDVRGLVTEARDPESGLVTQAYDVYGRPLTGTQKVSADRTVTTPAPVYDLNDNVTTSTAPNGAVSTATYDDADQVTASTAPKDTSTGPERKSTFTYDKVGNLLSSTEPKGSATTTAGDYTTSYAYDVIYQQTAVTNAAGDRIEYEYDQVGNMTVVRDPRKVASADPDDFTSRTEYDLNHRPVASVDAAGNRSTTSYDADSLPVESTDPLGNTSFVRYDERGAQVETKTPHSGTGPSTVYRTTQMEYDEVGNTTRVITPRGVATADTEDFAARTEYDALNRPVKQFQPYDPADARYNDANVFTQTTYDGAGRPVRTSMPPSEGQTARNTQRTEYFANGWIKSSHDVWGIDTTYEYDDLGAQTARTLTAADGSSSRTMEWAYYPDGKLKSKADDGVPVGSHSVVTDNDTAGLVKATGTWATGDVEGQQGTSHRTHAAGATTDEFEWTLDAPADGTYKLAATWPQVSGASTAAKYTLIKGASGSETSTAYTANQSTGAGAWNQLGTITLEKGDPVKVTLNPSTSGTVIADGVRLVRDNSADADTEVRQFAYEYDVNGNLTSIDDTSTGSAKTADDYAVTYTGLNQVASVREALTGSTDATTTAYTYDVLGQPLTVDHPDQRSEYTYDLGIDPRGPLTSLSVDDLQDAKSAKVTSYRYDELGRRTREVKGNGNIVTSTFFNDSALKTTREETSAGELVASHEYTYDANGNRATDVASKQNADTTGLLNSTTSYRYDPVDRLAQKAKTGNGPVTETYVHDDNANVVSQTIGTATTSYTYDRNRLLSVTKDGATASYRYDPFGRQTSVVSAGEVISRTTYDGFDHIARSGQMNDSGVLEATTYRYDPLDRTASMTADGKTTNYSYLGLSSEVLSEEVAGQLTKSYQYSPWGQRLSQVTHQADTEQGVEAGETAYYGYNAHTDVETLTDDTGEVVGTYGYTAYGSIDDAEVTGIDKPDAGNPTQAEPYNAYRYNAKRWDGSSGTYDMGFRDYDPGLNRFTTRDMYNGALANMGLGTNPYTNNRYAFGAGNPISMIEADGHWSWDKFGEAVEDFAGDALNDAVAAFIEPIALGAEIYNCYAGNDLGYDSCEAANNQIEANEQKLAGLDWSNVDDITESVTEPVAGNWEQGNHEAAVAAGVFIGVDLFGTKVGAADDVVDWVAEGGDRRDGPRGTPAQQRAYDYESGAAGARAELASGRAQVPRLSMPGADGSLVTAKFDGIDGNGTLIDRKRDVIPFTSDSMISEARRQAAVAAYNGRGVVWEVPNQAVLGKAQRWLDDAGVTTISLRVGL